MRETFERVVRVMKGGENLSYGLTIPKHLIDDQKVDINKVYTFIVTDEEVDKVRDNLLEQHAAEIRLLKRNIDSLQMSINELGRDLATVIQKVKHRLTGG